MFNGCRGGGEGDSCLRMQPAPEPRAVRTRVRAMSAGLLGVLEGSGVVSDVESMEGREEKGSRGWKGR